MENEQNETAENGFQNVFSRNAMEFATVAREYCVFAENNAKYSKADYLKVAARLLPLLYIKASVLPATEFVMEEGNLEEIVDEDAYESIRRGIHDKLTSHDDYLEVFKEDFKYSETPIAASISEDMADIYQDVRNFCEQYQSGMDEVMNDALAQIIESFSTYWGQRLCNALRAIHSVLYSGDDLKDETPAPHTDEEEDDDPMQGAPSNGKGNDMPYFLRQSGIRFTGGKK